MPVLSTARAHRRPLITAAVAASALFAMWFVPSAEGTPEPVTGTGTQAVTAEHAGSWTPGSQRAGSGSEAPGRAESAARADRHSAARTDPHGAADSRQGSGPKSRANSDKYDTSGDSRETKQSGQSTLSASDDGSASGPYLLGGLGLAAAAGASGVLLSRSRAPRTAPAGSDVNSAAR